MGFLLLATVVVVVAAIQHRRLSGLREEIASARRAGATSYAESSAFSAGDGGKKEVGALLAEARGLLDVLMNPEGADATRRTDRLMELLSGMDAAAVRSLLEETEESSDGEEMGKRLRRHFSAVNPRESFRLILDDPPDLESKKALLWEFSNWASLDPSGALKWYREAEEKALPLAKEKEVLLAVFTAQTRLDPKRAIENFREHFGKDAGAEIEKDVEQDITRFVSALRSQSERLAFMVALNKNTAANPGDASFRESVVAEISRNLVKEPFDEALAVIDGTFTPEERKKFAQVLAGGGFLNPDTWQRWMSWVVALDLPAERGHPIANMATVVARRPEEFKDPKWLAELPAGHQRDLAVEVYAMISMESDLNEAIRWMNYLPAGEQRRGVAANIAYYLKMKDPAGAEALRKREGVE